MAQKSYFFDSVDHDRIYTTADFARVFGAIAGRDGVIYGYGDELAVSPGIGMTVKVGTGAAFVQGRMLEVYDQAETLSIAVADATNPRIDRVVVRVDLSSSERRAYLAVKTGTPAATPAAPLLQQDSTIWEMSLAQVAIEAGATGIVVGDITDERLHTEVGNVANALAAHEAEMVAQNPHGIGNIAGQEYEEGECTLYLTGATTPPTMPVSVTGLYVRIGSLVTLIFAFYNVDTTGASGVLQISGLPFAIANVNYSLGSIRSNKMFEEAGSLYAPGGQNNLQVVSMLNLSPFQISAGTGRSLYGSITYTIRED